MKSISEKDLYVFVFSPEKLSNSKYKTISENEENFKTQLDLLVRMKEYLSTFKPGQVPDEIFEKIREIEQGSDDLVDELLTRKKMDYYVYKSKSKSKKKSA